VKVWLQSERVYFDLRVRGVPMPSRSILSTSLRGIRRRPPIVIVAKQPLRHSRFTESLEIENILANSPNPNALCGIVFTLKNLSERS
jgi:hypothetical protein